MKLRKFRLVYLILLMLLNFYSVFKLTDLIFNDNSAFFEYKEDIIVSTMCYGIGALFTLFEAYMVYRSNTQGTLMLNQICFKAGNKRRLLTGIIAVFGTILSLIFLMTFAYIRYFYEKRIITNFIIYDFMIYYAILSFVNFGILLSYYIFLRFDDITSFK